MCGFLGATGEGLDAAAAARLDAIARATTSHRGPDQAGLYTDGAAVIASFRLDLNGGDAGRQPWTSPDLVLAYNGEAYLLDGRPVAVEPGFGDTAAVAAHMRNEGRPEALDGMFAFAAWRTADRRLLLVRDRFGVKPLYWGEPGVGGGVVFGSSARGVRLVAGEPVVPQEAVAAYLSVRGPFADQELFEGVHAVPAGGAVAWSPGSGVAVTRWHHPLTASSEPAPESLEDALLAAVDLTMRATAPVGLCLSGGVDSSLLVAMACSLHGPDLPVYVLVSDTNADDVEAAVAVAEALGVRPRMVDMRASWPALLERMLPLLDEPPVTESAVGVAALAAAAAADGVKALISGEGADELFGGYDEYRARPFTGEAQVPERDWLARSVQPWLADGVDRFLARVDAKVAEHREGGGSQGTFDLDARLARLLRRLDAATMAFGIEGRVPFLLDGVARAAHAVPWEERVGGLGKNALRAVAGRWLPEAVAQRPKRSFASGVRARGGEVRAMLHRARPVLEEVVTPACLDACEARPDDPQAWKLAALGAYLTVHQLRVAMEVPA